MTRFLVVLCAAVTLFSTPTFGQNGSVAPMFSGRIGAERQRLLELYGGTPETENAVKQGLEWLSRQQAADGSWSLQGPYEDGALRENRTAATAMALIAFTGAGHTHQAGGYRQSIEKGLQWLVIQQDETGCFSRKELSHHQAYTQAQASIVLSESYALTGDPVLQEPAQLAIRYAENVQGPVGGWRYSPGSAGDLSVTGWYVMAMQTGLAAGLMTDRSRIDKTMDFLDTVQADDGALYGYLPKREATAGMTAEGLLCRQYLGWPHDHAGLKRGITRLANEWKFDSDNMDVYYWFHASQAIRHHGGSPWLAWNESMRTKLPTLQSTEGTEAGSWDPQQDRWGKSTGGRLFTTCFALYCLEVYYRHQPLYAAVVVE